MLATGSALVPAHPLSSLPNPLPMNLPPAPGPLRGGLHLLEAPLALLEGFALPSTQTRWTFPSANEAAIPKIFADAD